MNDFSQMTVEDYIRIINKRKWWILVPFVVFFCGGHVIVKILPKVYVANTLVLVEGQKVPRAYVQSTVTAHVEERLKTIQEEVMSRSRLYEIIERFKLFPDLRDTMSIDQLIGRMRKAIKIQIRHKDAFAIYYEGKDPKTVAQVANALTEQFINANLKLREEQARETANFLEEMLRDQQEILVKRETALAEFLRRHAGELPEHTERNLRLIEQLNLQMATKQESLKVANEEKVSLQKQILLLEEMAPEEMEDTTKTALRQKLTDLENELSLLKLTYTDSHPNVVLRKNQIDNLTALIYQTNDKKEQTVTNHHTEIVDSQKLTELKEKLKESSQRLFNLDEELATLQEKIKIQENLLKIQEEKWADFLEIHPDILPEPISQNLQLIEQLNVQIMTKQIAINQEKEEMGSLEDKIAKGKTKSSSSPKSIDPRGFELQKEKSALEKEILLLKATHNESHPVLQAKLKEINHLNRTLEKVSLEQREKEAKNKMADSIQKEKIEELSNKLMQIEDIITTLEEDQVKIQEQIRINHARVDNAPNLEVDLKELNRQYDQERKQYEELLGKNLDAELARKLELRQKGEQFIRLDEAVAPRAPYKPDKTRILMLSAVLGVGVGLGLAFAREFFDASFEEAKDVERILKVPALASIPHIKEFDTRKKWRFLLRRKDRNKISSADPSKNIPFLLENNIQSSIQEIYRVLKVKLEHHCKNKTVGNSLLITSTEPQEGKTTTATHLSWILSQGLDKKVVLIDCDFYKPKIASSLGIQASKKGLCEYLSGSAKISEILIPIQSGKFCVVTTGKVSENSEELLESTEMQNLLNELRTEFDYVILDVPSIMATVHEVNVLTPMVDHILFIVRAEKTHRNLVTHSFSLLNKEKLVGVVLNDARSTKRSTYDRYVQYKQNEHPESLETTSEIKEPSKFSHHKSNGQSKKQVNEKSASTGETNEKSEDQKNELSVNDLERKENSEKGVDVGDKPNIGIPESAEKLQSDEDITDGINKVDLANGDQLSEEIHNYLSGTNDDQNFPRNGSSGEDKSSEKAPSTTTFGSHRSKNERTSKKTTGPNLIPNPLRSATNDSKSTKETNSAKTYIRMILDDKEGNPYAYKSYKLVVDGKEYSGKTNSKGLVDEEIPANSRKGELSLRVNDNDPSEVLIWPLHISKS